MPARSEQLGHPGELAGPHDEVDVRRAAENRLLVLLCHAAQHADLDLGLALLEPLDPAQGAIDLVLGVLADRAGVVKDRVGLVDSSVSSYPSVAQLGHHQLAVEHVHLTADGLDVELLAGPGR